MRFRLSGVALAALALLACALPAHADGFPVRDGSGATQTFCSKLNSAVQHPCHVLELLFGGIPAALSGGQQTKGNSLPVVLPSDPDFRSTTAAITAADVASTTVAGQNSVTLVTGSPTANSSIVWALNGHSSATITVTGTFVLSSSIEESADGGVTYGPATAKILGAGATSGTVTAPGVFRIDATGMTHVRLRATSFTSGTQTAQLVGSAASGLTQVLNPIRLADATGAVTGVAANPLYFNSADGGEVTIGALADAACATDNGTCSIGAVLKRVAQRLTTINTTLGTPMQQSGGTVGLVAGSALIGKAGIDQTTPGTTNNVAASSIQASVVATPIVTASSAYASGNTLGGLLTLTSAVRSSGSTALLQKVVVNYKSAQTAPVDILIFNQSPGSTTVTDKTAVAVAVADFDKLVGVVHVTDCTAAGTPSACQASGLALSLKATGSANLYAVVVTRGTPTFTATTDVSVNFFFIQD